MIPIATLNGVDLPISFSYQPYVPRKRNSVTPTAGAVVIQTSDPQIIHGDSSFAWTCPDCHPDEWQALWDYYNTDTPEILTFEGYWGEILEVLLTELDSPSVRGRIFDASGSFQVVCVTQDYNAVCNP